jgi:hypothetical protein
MAGFEKQNDLLALGNPGVAEADTHAPAQRLGIQQSLRQRFGYQEPADPTPVRADLVARKVPFCPPPGLNI